MTLIIDKKIPNDNGYLIATAKGRVFDSAKYFHLTKVPVAKKEKPEDPAGKNTAPTGPDMTDEFHLEFDVYTLEVKALNDMTPSEKELNEVIKDLTGQKVSIRLEHFVPTGSPTDRLLEDIRYQLELNRLGQFQLAH